MSLLWRKDNTLRPAATPGTPSSQNLHEPTLAVTGVRLLPYPLICSLS
jgi:hypothetical protein